MSLILHVCTSRTINPLHYNKNSEFQFINHIQNILGQGVALELLYTQQMADLKIVLQLHQPVDS